MATITQRRGARASAQLMILPILHRLAFYGAIVLALAFVAQKASLSLPGEMLWPFFTGVATICGAIYAGNIPLLNKLNDLEKNSALGYWGRTKLHRKTDRRRQIIMIRVGMGAIFSLATGALAAYLRDSELILTGWRLSLAVCIPFFTVVLAMVSVVEAYAISKAEATLNRLKEDEKERQRLREALAGDDEDYKAED